jgi:YlzJ-like protein
MILYTMMPQDLVFPPEEQQQSSGQMMVNYKGIPVLAEQVDVGSYQIIRVMSTDPSHYLNTDCAPGTKISFS